MAEAREGLNHPDVRQFVRKQIGMVTSKAWSDATKGAKTDAVDTIIADTTATEGIATVRFKASRLAVAEQQSWKLWLGGKATTITDKPLVLPGVDAVELLDDEDEPLKIASTISKSTWKMT